MTKTAGKITALLGVLILIAVAVFIGCAGENTSITDPNGQLQNNSYGADGLPLGNDPTQTQNSNTIDDGTILPTNVIQGQNQVDTLIISSIQTKPTK